MKISELMDNYTDNEFLIKGDTGADAESVFNKAAARVKPRKHLKPRTKIIAVAAAAVLGVSAVVGWTFSPTVLITRTGGKNEWSRLDTSSGISAQAEIEPYEVIDGRVYFTAVGEGEKKIDVTDTVCSGKAFIYQYTQKDSWGGEHICLLAIGGDPENMGYAEAVFGTGTKGTGSTVSISGSGSELFYWIDGKAVAEKDLTEEQMKHINDYPKNWVGKPWTYEFKAEVMRLKGYSEEDIETTLKEEMERNNMQFYYTPLEGTGIVEPFVPGDGQ